MSNEVKTQGTEIYLLDSDESPDLVRKIGNVPSLGAVGGEADDIETTNLDALKFKEYISGLMDPGSPTMPFNLSDWDDQWAAVHDRLLEIQGGDRYWFAIGWSDGHGIVPTISAGEFVLPNTRTWIVFFASIKAAPIEFEQNNIVKCNATLRVSGAFVIQRKSA